MISLQAIRGFRDLYPSDKAVQNYIFDTLKTVATLYGFENYDGPLLEPIELYLGKSSRELVEEQTFNMKDKSDQTLVLRPEMTPSLARMVANKANGLIFPLKLFNLGLRYRYETPQKGREREFYQADYDILGVDNVLADAEIVAVAAKIFELLGATEKDFTIRINSREFMKKRLTEFGVTENSLSQALTLIDRFEKLSKDEWKKQALNIDGLNSDRLQIFLEEQSDSQNDPYFQNLFTILKSYNVVQYCVLDKSIVRGLDYYTGLVFEVKENGGLKRSLLGGGRYNNLTEKYNPYVKIPGVGFATSDVVLTEFIKNKNLAPELNSKQTRYLVTVFNSDTVQQSLSILQQLRSRNIPAELYPDPEKKLDKQIKFADRNKIPYVIILGPDEIAKNVVKVKDMKTGEQEEVKIEDMDKLILS